MPRYYTEEHEWLDVEGEVGTVGISDYAQGQLGDIVFVDAPDMQRRLAEQIIANRPAAVVNLAPYSTGTLPTFGPHLLLDADVPLFEAAGTEMREKIRDGKKVTVSPSVSLQVPLVAVSALPTL